MSNSDPTPSSSPRSKEPASPSLERAGSSGDVDRRAEHTRVANAMGPRSQNLSVTEPVDSENMTPGERQGRVLRKLIETIYHSRQSAREWADAAIAYAAMIDETSTESE